MVTSNSTQTQGSQAGDELGDIGSAAWAGGGINGGLCGEGWGFSEDERREGSRNLKKLDGFLPLMDVIEHGNWGLGFKRKREKGGVGFKGNGKSEWREVWVKREDIKD